MLTKRGNGLSRRDFIRIAGGTLATLGMSGALTPKLARALEELGETPPMYIAGTCNGRMLYTFYNSLENVYGNVPVGGLPAEYLNSLEFTPLQILEMNDYISSH